jgi:hypothetical protein
MIINATSNMLQREAILQKCRELKKSGSTVIDVGGSLGFWCREVTTHYADLIQPTDADERKKRYYIVDISDQSTWVDILNYVERFGKFEYSICTQTLEHTTNVKVALDFLSQISKRGFVGVPNKWVELSFFVALGEEGIERCKLTKRFRGFLPHRWIFTVKENRLWAFPKLNFVNNLILPWVDNEFRSDELSFEWENYIPLFEVSDIFLDTPDPQSAVEFYYENLKEGI